MGTRFQLNDKGSGCFNLKPIELEGMSTAERFCKRQSYSFGLGYYFLRVVEYFSKNGDSSTAVDRQREQDGLSIENVHSSVMNDWGVRDVKETTNSNSCVLLYRLRRR